MKHAPIERASEWQQSRFVFCLILHSTPCLWPRQKHFPLPPAFKQYAWRSLATKLDQIAVASSRWVF